MKKLMKKKVNLFGKEISVFVIALFGIALVSAALVPYLSGVITGDAIVESPLVLSGDLATMSTETIYGGNELTKTLNIANQANDVVDYSVGFTVTGPANSIWDAEVAEFEEFTLDGTSVPMGTVCESTENVLTCDFGDDSLAGTLNKDYTIFIDFNVAILPGDYTFEARAFTTSTGPTDFEFTTP